MTRSAAQYHATLWARAVMEPPTAPVERVLVALAELRALLGPDALEIEGSMEDPGTLEHRVDDGIATLRRIVPGYTGPEVAIVAALALELGEIRLMLAGERVARRLDCLLQVQRALARLRAVGSLTRG